MTPRESVIKTIEHNQIIIINAAVILKKNETKKSNVKAKVMGRN